MAVGLGLGRPGGRQHIWVFNNYARLRESKPYPLQTKHNLAVIIGESTTQLAGLTLPPARESQTRYR